ncbi:MAG: Na+/H+ antiporter NhaA, partial [Methylobacteriaceae bacterium]|nr:Na+/H+ antiporter NhaA [Methylobacteriaceae bacterium]
MHPGAVLRRLLHSEASGGVVLMASAAAALAVANSAWAPAYLHALETYIGPLSLLHWVNDALMALFFLLVGLEI